MRCFRGVEFAKGVSFVRLRREWWMGRGGRNWIGKGNTVEIPLLDMLLGETDGLLVGSSGRLFDRLLGGF